MSNISTLLFLKSNYNVVRLLFLKSSSHVARLIFQIFCLRYGGNLLQTAGYDAGDVEVGKRSNML